VYCALICGKWIVCIHTYGFTAVSMCPVVG